MCFLATRCYGDLPQLPPPPEAPGAWLQAELSEELFVVHGRPHGAPSPLPPPGPPRPSPGPSGAEMATRKGGVKHVHVDAASPDRPILMEIRRRIICSTRLRKRVRCVHPRCATECQCISRCAPEAVCYPTAQLKRTCLYTGSTPPRSNVLVVFTSSLRANALSRHRASSEAAHQSCRTLSRSMVEQLFWEPRLRPNAANLEHLGQHVGRCWPRPATCPQVLVDVCPHFLGSTMTTFGQVWVN